MPDLSMPEADWLPNVIWLLQIKWGVVDSDYRGEFMVALHNHSNVPQTIEPKERIAQLVITPYIVGDFAVVDELEETERGVGGFGSTGR